ncbi:hypothetical protein D3C72_2008720 [compost metagenome]
MPPKKSETRPTTPRSAAGAGAATRPATAGVFSLARAPLKLTTTPFALWENWNSGLTSWFRVNRSRTFPAVGDSSSDQPASAGLVRRCPWRASRISSQLLNSARYWRAANRRTSTAGVAPTTGTINAWALRS